MKVISENRRARFDYSISETYDAGIELKGFEVKSAKSGRLNISGSYGLARHGEVWLINSQIPPYQPKNTPLNYDPGRPRRLLMRKEEIETLAGQLHGGRLSLVPLRAYLKNSIIKIELGLGRPRKKSDKREIIKERAAKREIKKVLG